MENFQFGSQHIQILFNKFGEFKEALLNDSPHEINTVQASRWMNSPVGIVKVNFDVAIKNGLAVVAMVARNHCREVRGMYGFRT